MIYTVVKTTTHEVDLSDELCHLLELKSRSSRVVLVNKFDVAQLVSLVNEIKRNEAILSIDHIRSRNVLRAIEVALKPINKYIGTGITL
jgi:hypothetical protein